MKFNWSNIIIVTKFANFYRLFNLNKITLIFLVINNKNKIFKLSKYNEPIKIELPIGVGSRKKNQCFNGKFKSFLIEEKDSLFFRIQKIGSIWFFI